MRSHRRRPLGFETASLVPEFLKLSTTASQRTAGYLPSGSVPIEFRRGRVTEKLNHCLSECFRCSAMRISPAVAERQAFGADRSCTIGFPMAMAQGF